jgi:tRNA A-37 threonylcarbamoyl transferase component Bud32
MARDQHIGSILEDRYQIIERIGRGAMGAVYRAKQLKVDRDVAVKILKSELSEDASIVNRFQNEARILSQLRHPNTIRLFDFGSTEDGSLYLVCELLRGQPLASLGTPQPVLRTLRILKEICDALVEAHAQGIVHRDLKPSNVFLESVGTQEFVKVLDFGIARLSSTTSKRTTTGLIMGTPAYMSPEQAQSTPADARSDLYSLGVIAYEYLSGALPFDADTPLGLMMKHLSEPAIPLATAAPNVPSDVSALVHRMLEKDPSKRPESAIALKAELEELMARHAGRPDSSPPAPTIPAPVIPEAAFATDAIRSDRVAKSAPKRGAWIAFGLAMAAASIITLGLLVREPAPSLEVAALDVPPPEEPVRAEAPAPREAPEAKKKSTKRLETKTKSARTEKRDVAPASPADTAPPKIQILRPEEAASVSPQETIEIAAEATDDVAVGSVTLVFVDDLRMSCPGSGEGWSCAQLGRTYAWRVAIDPSLHRFRIEAKDSSSNVSASPERHLKVMSRTGPAPDHAALVRALARRGLNLEDLRRIAPGDTRRWAAWRKGELSLGPEESMSLFEALMKAAREAKIDRDLIRGKLDRVRNLLEQYAARRQGQKPASGFGALSERHEKLRARLESATEGELPGIVKLANDLEHEARVIAD